MITSLQYINRKDCRFWQIEVVNNKVFLVQGKIGTEGTSQSNEFPTADLAIERANKLVAGKRKKGYVDAEEIIDMSLYKCINTIENEALKQRIWAIITNMPQDRTHTFIEGDLIIDGVYSPDNYDVSIVMGDLVTDSNVVSLAKSGEGYNMLLVLGDVSCKNIICYSETYLFVVGDLAVKDLIYSCGEDSSFGVYGAVRAGYIYSGNGAAPMSMYGKDLECKGMEGYVENSEHRYNSPVQYNIKSILVPEVKYTDDDTDDDNEYIDELKVLERMVKGQPILI